MVKSLNLTFDDKEFEKLKEVKQEMDSRSWKDFFRKGIECLEEK